MIQEAIASQRPGDLLRAEEPVLAEGRGRPRPRAACRCTPAASCAQGTDVTLVGHGAMVATLLQAAEHRREEGTSCEVIDLRSLSPIDYGPILDSVQTTGRMVVRAGGARLRERRLRDRRDRHGAGVLLARGAGAARVGLRHPVPAGQARGRRTCPTPTASSRPSTAPWRTDRAAARPRRHEMSEIRFPLPDVGEGLTEAEIVSWQVAPGDTSPSTRCSSRSRRRSRSSSCRRRSPARSASCSSTRATPSTSARRS